MLMQIVETDSELDPFKARAVKITAGFSILFKIACVNLLKMMIISALNRSYYERLRLRWILEAKI